MSALATPLRPARKAASLLAVSALTAVALVAGGVPGAAAAAHTEVPVPGAYASQLNVGSDAREADRPLLLPTSTTELAFRIPTDGLNLDAVSYRLSGADFEVTGVVELTAEIIEIPVPADFFAVFPDHSPIDEGDGRLYYDVTLEAAGPADAPNPPDDDRSGDTFRADLTYQRHDGGTSARAFFDLSRTRVDWYSGSALRRAPERILVRSGDAITLTADRDYFWVVAHSSPFPGRWTIDNALNGLHELDTVISNDGRSLTLTLPYQDGDLRYGDQDLVVTRQQGFDGFGDVEDMVIPVHVLAPSSAAAPAIGAASGGDGSATVHWQAPDSDGGAPIVGYQVRVFSSGALVRTVTVDGRVTSAVIDALANGTEYTFDVAAITSEGMGAVSPRSNPVVPGSAAIRVDRLTGSDRFEVSATISREAYPEGARVAYLTTGHDYPDALSAGAAAAREGGPLLLSRSAELPASVRTELLRLNPERIVVVGGQNAIAESVLTSLRRLVPNTVRVAGSDRFDTSREVVRYAFGNAAVDGVYVATGTNFPDALSAGGAAGAHGDPVLLLDGRTSTVDGATLDVLGDLGIDSVHIVGGPVSVSAGIEAQLDRDFATTRLSGADRFATASAVNRDAFTSAPRVFLATGHTFPDALAGSALAGRAGAPLYVVHTDCVPAGVLSDLAALRTEHVTLLGGTDALALPVEDLTVCR
ncbi:cell wall-binding repeat-containing protein [Planctomonas psychrotolerans]|uniref:cell wall-binding repeat-containing protein n=1 Tax=Planctomonas psychrotolerans TaxID=2528712 RepID=UPI001239BCE4|nr:cell wall-binding repeat-containing protein [Planctomonas psychrotolerans]